MNVLNSGYFYDQLRQMAFSNLAKNYERAEFEVGSGMKDGRRARLDKK